MPALTCTRIQGVACAVGPRGRRAARPRPIAVPHAEGVATGVQSAAGGAEARESERRELSSGLPTRVRTDAAAAATGADRPWRPAREAVRDAAELNNSGALGAASWEAASRRTDRSGGGAGGTAWGDQGPPREAGAGAPAYLRLSVLAGALLLGAAAGARGARGALLRAAGLWPGKDPERVLPRSASFSTSGSLTLTRRNSGLSPS
jgi:hypothetical protein